MYRKVFHIVGLIAALVLAVLANPASATHAASYDTTAIKYLTPYVHPTGMFWLDVPANWYVYEDSEPGRLTTMLLDPESPAEMSVSIYAAPGDRSQGALAEFGEYYVSYMFGAQPGFFYETRPQADGSVLIAFNVSADEASTNQVGLTFVQLHGDKISLLTLLVPESEYEYLWNTALYQVVDSLGVNAWLVLP